jgi:hypothetical protein
LLLEQPVKYGAGTIFLGPHIILAVIGFCSQRGTFSPLWLFTPQSRRLFEPLCDFGGDRGAWFSSLEANLGASLISN